MQFNAHIAFFVFLQHFFIMLSIRNIHRWRIHHLNGTTFLILLALLVGLMSGLAAVALKTVVHYVGSLVTQFSEGGASSAHLLLFISPAGGMLLTVLFVNYVVKGDIGHGLPSVLFAISRKKSRLPQKNMYTSLIASTLTVAFGGSVGLEAPIASTGAAIGSNIGQWTHLSPKNVRLLLGCGAAGAIAGIFKAPFAGILFVVEVFMFDLTATTALPLIVASLSAATIASFLMGSGIQFTFTIATPFSLSQLPFYIVLGLFCALVSLYFLRASDRVESRLKRVSSKWVRLLIGGSVLGLLVLLFPPLYGEGYTMLSHLLTGKEQILMLGTEHNPQSVNSITALLPLFLIILFKPLATALTIGSGGVGGTFGPSLVVGGLSGYFVALVSNLIGLPPQDPANFALVGMAAVMTGVMQAPFMATFLIAEITGGYGLLVPLLAASAVTYLCVHPLERHSIYARKLAQHGDLLTHDKDASAWHMLDMSSLIETNFVVVRQGDRLRDVVEAVKNTRRNIFPVLTDDDKFLGVIVLDDIRKLIFRTDLYDSMSVTSMMHPMSEGDLVRNSDSLIDVVGKFRVGNRYNLVVIDDHDNYLGFISRANTFSAYRRFINDTTDE